MKMTARAQAWIRGLAPMSGLICSGEGDDGDDDAGGGGGGDDDLGGLTESQMKAIDKRMHATVSTHLTRFRTSFEKDLTKTIQGAINPVHEQLTAMAEEKAKKGGKKDDDADADAEQRKKYESRIADLEKARDDERKLREEEAAKAARKEERSVLSDALREAGVDNSRVRAAVALLNEDGVVGRDDDGKIVWKIQRAGYTDEVALEAGIAEWLKTEEGKAHLPARGVAGSGGTGSQRGKRSGKQTPDERRADARRILLSAHGIDTE